MMGVDSIGVLARSGQSGKGLGKKVVRRHCKVPPRQHPGPAIRRLARCGGLKRISGLVYEEICYVLKAFLEGAIGVMRSLNASTRSARLSLQWT
ncbi:unnamed protein product [Gongylonema pulchrum]|uniref:Histone H4 n=1 Tax=Gongylonema pulchrum TaxID=637853 RepID=A0A183EZE4_9BILA|nr:unnamed protein product [Gongylonema pulchrum]